MPSSSLPSPQSPVDSVPATGHHQTNDNHNKSKTGSPDTQTKQNSQESTQRSSPKQDSSECEAQAVSTHLELSDRQQPLSEPPRTPQSPQSSATAAVAALSVHRSVSQEVHQMQTQSSFLMRFSSRLRIKSRLVCCIYLITTFLSLFILVLIAIIIFLYWKPISRAIIIQQNIQQKEKCLPLKVTVCQKYRIPYAYTTLPNKFGQTDQSEISQQLMDYEPIMSVKCYALLPLFLCSQLAPKCNHSGQPVPMCRTLCRDCDGNGFRCDSSRCIPYSWKCDGFADCRDFSDENNCNNCTESQFHCGNRVCILKSEICDGIQDCPDGRDERQCLRLSKSMKDSGEGRLEAWSAESNSWQAVCGEHWNTSYQSQKACNLLGYKSMNETRIKDETTIQSLELYNRAGTAIGRHTQMKVLFDKERNKGCKNGKNMTVHLKCKHFECGKSANFVHRKRRRRIVGGNESHPGKWPWLVALHGGPEEVFFCGAVLISERWVLTAAHCIGNQTDVKGWTVNLGVTRRTASPFSVQKRKVLSLLKHPGFNPGANMYSSDIALILLDKSVDFDEFLRPICLPTKTTSIATGTHCTVIGWGKKIHDDDADYLSAIHEVQVPIVDHKVCADWYSKQDVLIPRTMLCAGYEYGRKDACQGDSGGPLLCRNGHHNWFVAGVVSWGINCAQPQLPGIYTNVPMFIEWIEGMAQQMGYPLIT